MKSKAKGNTFERKISKVLSGRFEHITGKTDSFRRNPDSGSFFGGSNKARLETHDTEHACFGDIICPPDFIYIVECKHYKSPPSLNAILDGKVALWDEWIAQARQASESSGKSMMIVIKYNNTKEFVVVDSLPMARKPLFYYKDSLIVTMEDLLSCPNEHFFDACHQGLITPA